MSFIRQALEECQACEQKKNADNTANQPVNTNVTYNDGQGIKDTVVVDGPLSEVFTKALNVKFKKQPITGEETPDEEKVVTKQEALQQETNPLLRKNSNEKIGIGNESQQQDHEEEFVFNELDKNSEQFKYIANSFDFVQKSEVPIKVTSKTTIFTVGDFLKPDNLIKFADDKTDSPVEHVVVLVSDALGRTRHTTTTSKFVTIPTSEDNFKDTVFKDEQQYKEVTAVVESHFKPYGYKVVLGIEGYAELLAKMAKDLSYRK